ncbi:hypothetical protein [Paenibacillus sp. Y412MC10]|uniref:hypothetical protein n=1 Tax=Geobacillus sp. (strain Y412MC10) TaxID=481743 RepID=UPI0011A32F5F|nr:hypothetical protein [Paenibacillus sp. Y412MC10]
MTEQERRELIHELAHWTQYGYIEGSQDVQQNYDQAAHYMQELDKLDGLTRPLPPLSDILDYYRERVRELQEKGQRGRNMIIGGEYGEFDQLTDLLRDAAQQKTIKGDKLQ